MFRGMGIKAKARSWRIIRQGSSGINPATVSGRAAAFAVPAVGSGSSALIAVRDEDGLRGYFAATDTVSSNTAAMQLAHTVEGRLEHEDFPAWLAETPAIGELRVDAAHHVYKDTQAGADPSETARALANSMPQGSWIAASIRRPTKREAKLHRRWLVHRLATANPQHHSLSPQAITVSFFAGGNDREEVKTLLSQISAELPGFDLGTRPRILSRRPAVLKSTATAVLLGLATVLGFMFAPEPLASAAWWALGAAIGALIFAVSAGAGWLPGPDDRVRKSLLRGQVPAPSSAPARVRAPKKEQTLTSHRTLSDGTSQSTIKHIKDFGGDYPLASSAFLVAPHVIVGLVAPGAGTVSGVVTTADRQVPAAVLERIGPMIGTSPQGEIYLSVEELLFFAACFGDAGSGKSRFIRALYGWFVLDRALGSHLPGAPGARNTLIAFESKGEGTAKYLEYAALAGESPYRVDVADATSAAIDLFAVPGNAQRKAEFFVNAMQYAFSEGSIQDRSAETLRSLLTAALAVTAEIAAAAGPALDPHGSPIYFAHILCGGRGDDLGVSLAGAIRQARSTLQIQAARDGDRFTQDTALADTIAADDALSSLYGSTTPAQRRPFLEAPRNKLDSLLTLDHFFGPGRQKLSWQNILENHEHLIVNLGTTDSGSIIEDSTAQVISSLLMFSLQNAIKRQCSGWLEQDRYVTIFSDELSLLAGSTPEVLAWLRDQGRSSGVRAMFATQRPEQLPARLRTSLMSYRTLISYAQTDSDTASEVARAVSGAAGEWTEEDVKHLPKFTAVVRTTVGVRQPAFKVAMEDFESDLTSFARRQGFDPRPTTNIAEQDHTVPVVPRVELAQWEDDPF